MGRGTLGRIAAVALVAASLGMGTAGAAERPAWAASPRASVLAGARVWLGELLAFWGLEPAGRWSVVTGDDGLIIDPNGAHATPSGPTTQPQTGTLTTDDGHGIDPNG